MHRIQPDQHDNLCPDCKTAEHTTVHLFECTANPTQLEVTDLWHRPAEAASFLNLPTSLAEMDEDLLDPG